MTIVSPHTGRPVAPPTADERKAPESEMESPEVAGKAVAARYKVAAGKLIIAREKVKATWASVQGLDGQVRDIVMTEDRHELVQMFEPWGTILLVGEPYITESGTVIRPDPEWQIGRRVLVAATGATDVDLKAGDVEMTVSLVGFRAIHLVDMGEQA